MTMPGASEAARQIRCGERSAEALLSECLARIAKYNPDLNAFVHLDATAAARAARAIDDVVRRGNAHMLGPLAGVPFGVKDLEDCAGMPTTRGSRWFKNQPPVARDDIHVERLRAAGAIPIGKTAAPEFGAWAYTASPALGVTRNPWNRMHTPGGSSGGSAAAVTAGLTPFCTASDGGGSIRTPASSTGLVGLKCTYGRIPTFGVTHLAQNAVVGSLTTTVADTALLLDIMAGPDARDRTALPSPSVSFVDAIDHLSCKGLRAAWTADLGFAVVDPDVARLCKRAANAFVTAIECELIDRAFKLEDFTLTYARMEGADMFVDMPAELWQQQLGALDPLVAPSWRSTQRVTLPKFAAVESQRRKIVERVALLLDGVDFLLTPMVAAPPFAAEGPMPTSIGGREVHAGMMAVHGMLANLVNLPAISIPAGTTADGLPIGLQVIGPRYREDLLLAAAARYEAAQPWPRLCPQFS